MTLLPPLVPLPLAQLPPPALPLVPLWLAPLTPPLVPSRTPLPVPLTPLPVLPLVLPMLPSKPLTLPPKPPRPLPSLPSNLGFGLCGPGKKKAALGRLFSWALHPLAPQRSYFRSLASSCTMRCASADPSGRPWAFSTDTAVLAPLLFTVMRYWAGVA